MIANSKSQDMPSRGPYLSQFRLTFQSHSINKPPNRVPHLIHLPPQPQTNRNEPTQCSSSSHEANPQRLRTPAAPRSPNLSQSAHHHLHPHRHPSTQYHHHKYGHGDWDTIQAWQLHSVAHALLPDDIRFSEDLLSCCQCVEFFDLGVRYSVCQFYGCDPVGDGRGVH